MPKALSESDLRRFQRDGFLFPVPAIGDDDAAALCRRLADHEAVAAHEAAISERFANLYAGTETRPA